MKHFSVLGSRVEIPRKLTPDDRVKLTPWVRAKLTPLFRGKLTSHFLS